MDEYIEQVTITAKFGISKLHIIFERFRTSQTADVLSNGTKLKVLTLHQKYGVIMCILETVKHILTYKLADFYKFVFKIIDNHRMREARETIISEFLAHGHYKLLFENVRLGYITDKRLYQTMDKKYIPDIVKNSNIQELHYFERMGMFSRTCNMVHFILKYPEILETGKFRATMMDRGTVDDVILFISGINCVLTDSTQKMCNLNSAIDFIERIRPATLTDMVIVSIAAKYKKIDIECFYFRRAKQILLH